MSPSQTWSGGASVRIVTFSPQVLIWCLGCKRVAFTLWQQWKPLRVKVLWNGSNGNEAVWVNMQKEKENQEEWEVFDSWPFRSLLPTSIPLGLLLHISLSHSDICPPFCFVSTTAIRCSEPSQCVLSASKNALTSTARKYNNNQKTSILIIVLITERPLGSVGLDSITSWFVAA